MICKFIQKMEAKCRPCLGGAADKISLVHLNCCGLQRKEKGININPLAGSTGEKQHAPASVTAWELPWRSARKTCWNGTGETCSYSMWPPQGILKSLPSSSKVFIGSTHLVLAVCLNASLLPRIIQNLPNHYMAAEDYSCWPIIANASMHPKFNSWRISYLMVRNRLCLTFLRTHYPQTSLSELLTRIQWWSRSNSRAGKSNP